MQPILSPPKLTGTSFEQDTKNLRQPEYQRRAVQEVMNNNVPDFMRQANFREIVIRGKVGGRDVEAHIRVCSDVISVGTNRDYVRLSLSAPDGQRLAEHFGCVLPTEKLVDIMDSEAKKMGSYLPFRSAPEIANRVIDPQTSQPLGRRWNPNRPSGRWMMSAIFSNVQSRMTDEDVNALRPTGDPIYTGHKKETVYHPYLVGRSLVAFWRPPITPHKGWLPHPDSYYDYSQAVRLIDPNVTLIYTNRDKTKETVHTTMAEMIKDEKNTGVYALVSDYRMDITQMYRQQQAPPVALPPTQVPVRAQPRRQKIILDEIRQ